MKIESCQLETIFHSLPDIKAETKKFVIPVEERVTCSIPALQEKGTIQKGVCREYEFDSNYKTKDSVVGRLKKKKKKKIHNFGKINYKFQMLFKK